MMDNAISDYRSWKQQGETLRAQAKHAMETRFRELLVEAARISQEYQADFGSVLKPPAPVITFRFKAAAVKASATKNSPTKTSPAKASTAKPTSAAVAVPAPPNAKITALEKRLSQVRAKLAAAQADGKPTRNFEDKIYEIEDEIRLASHTE